MPVSILFVCLGNICRSPTAEQVLRDMVVVQKLSDKFHIDSAGTGDWHIGQPPDRRAQQTALKHGYDLSNLRARQVTKQDFDNFDLIIAMDETNIQNLQKIDASHPQKIKLLLSYNENSAYTAVPDPYFGDSNSFENTLDLIEQGCAQLLQQITKKRL